MNDPFHGDMPNGFGEAMRQVSWLAWHLTRKTGGRVEADDVAQEGFTALVVAGRKFDPERGVPFASYGMIRARGAMQDYIRKQSGMRSGRARPSHLEVVSIEGLQDGLETLADRGEPGPEDRAMMKVEAEAVEEAILGLDPRRQAIVRARQGGQTLREIAGAQGLSSSGVAALLWDAQRELRGALREREVI